MATVSASLSLLTALQPITTLIIPLLPASSWPSNHIKFLSGPRTIVSSNLPVCRNCKTDPNKETDGDARQQRLHDFYTGGFRRRILAGDKARWLTLSFHLHS